MNNARTMIRCCLPLPNGHKHRDVIDRLEHNLAEEFGGFTRYHMMGAWKNDASQIEREYGCVYEVSFSNLWLLDRATTMFQLAARHMGQKWCHIERHEFEAMHAEVGGDISHD